MVSASAGAVEGWYQPAAETVYPCSYRYNPVCGSDGLTYYNQCILKYSNDNNRYKGQQAVYETNGYCKECKCQNVNLPVCTTDGVTYANECELDCVNQNRIKCGLSIINLAYRKKCLGPPCDCPSIASPVCGSDEVLYRNECELNCASRNTIASGLPEITLKNVGACRDGCSCPTTYQPVCGSDGKTYGNPCELECQNNACNSHKQQAVQPLYNGKCDECVCTDVKYPVCASDGTTFKNKCRFDCENLKRYNAGQPALTELGKGECVGCICEATHDPICGTDRNVYENDCILKCENRARLEKGFQEIDILYKGKCENTSSKCVCDHCSDVYEPKCGDDYATYWNYCWLKCFSDCNEAKGLKVIQVMKNESCM